MSKISDFDCMVDGCGDDASEIVLTDDDDVVMLCRHHYDACWMNATLKIRGQELMQDSTGSWFFLPEKGGE